MSPSPSPRQVTIDLEKFHEDGLRHLAGVVPHESKKQLLKIVFSRGLVAMLESEFERYQPSAGEVAGNMNAAKEHMQKLRSRDSVGASKLRSSAQRTDPGRSARAPFGMKRSLDELHVQEAERDKEVARMNRDLGLAETSEGGGAPGNRLVENFIAVPLSQGLRRGLQSLMNAYPDVEEENLFTALLEHGLKKVQEDPKTLAPWGAAGNAGLPLGSKEASRQQLRTEWKALCRNVARGWR